jgi:hypothetical protein
LLGGVVLAVAALAPQTVAPRVSAGPVPQPLTVSLTGANGVGRIQDPGRPCSDGGSGQYRHIGIESALPTTPNAVISASLPAVIRGTFDVHHDGSEPVGSPVGPPVNNQAFLQGTESHVTLSNQRGSVALRLSSGSCANPTLAYDGLSVGGNGTWTVDPDSTTGSYHPLPPNPTTGSGTFQLALGVAPGADNPWALLLNGQITVPQPGLQVDVVSTSWGNLGVDYVTRRVTVVYRVTNTGPGDTFGAVVTEASSPTPGVTPLGPVPQNLGDLLHGESTTFTVRYAFTLLAGPCQLVILGCKFDTKVSVKMPDVLDKADNPPPSRTNQVTAPNFPPPL